MATEKQTVKVWDPLVRIGHWTLVIAFFIAYITEDDWLLQHVWAGYVVGGVVLIRVIWGFAGSKHARFSDFLYSPAHSLGYLKNLFARKPQHYIGHNPAGGLMVLALLLSLAGTTVTGLKLYAVEENKGPLAMSAQTVQPISLISEAKADDDEDEEDEVSEVINSGMERDEKAEEFWEELHETFANLTLLLVFLHIGGVVASSFIDKENLVKAMVTGKKDIDDSYQ